jgi:spore photoproduct lyase
MAVQIRERKTPFIHLNDTAKPGIVCGPFHALSYYIGCPYQCSYCYLQGTFRGRVDPVLYSNRERLLAELDAWLEQPGELRLNAGELEDSLALDGRIPLVDDLVPRFAAQRQHKLLLVSKSTNVRNLLKHDPKGQVIVAFSVNAPPVWERFEHETPHPLRRARAAARVKAASYYVTLRLDPMLPIDGWEEAYSRAIDNICGIVEPDQWTIGSLRYFPTLPHWTRRVGRDDSIYEFGQERSKEDGRKRIDLETRAAMYRLAFERIRAHQPKATIRLCKETAELYEAVGMRTNGCCYSAAVTNGRKQEIL